MLAALYSTGFKPTCLTLREVKPSSPSIPAPTACMQHLQAIRTASIQAKKAPRESWAEVMKVAQPSLNLWVTREAETAGGITASLVSAAPPLGRAARQTQPGARGWLLQRAGSEDQ